MLGYKMKNNGTLTDRVELALIFGIFSCEGISLYMEYLDYPRVLYFLNFTHAALESCRRRWGLCDLWMHLVPPALEALVDERFVEWEFIQRLRFIRLEVVSFCASLHTKHGLAFSSSSCPPGDPDWISCLFWLPDCLAMDVTYCIQDDDDNVDWSAHAFDIMNEVMRVSEDARVLELP